MPGYAWKAKFGGMDAAGAKRLKALEDENGTLKRLLAVAMPGQAASEAARMLPGQEGGQRLPMPT